VVNGVVHSLNKCRLTVPILGPCEGTADAEHSTAVLP
jgi:hypothetical protein